MADKEHSLGGELSGKAPDRIDLIVVPPELDGNANDLFNRAYNSKRSVDEYRWAFRDSPYGGSAYYAAVSEDRVVSFKGMMKIAMCNGDATFTIAKLENSGTEPAFQGQGLQSKVFRFMMTQLEAEGYDGTWIFPTPAMVRVSAKSGFRELGIIQHCFSIYRLGSALSLTVGLNNPAVNACFNVLGLLLRFLMRLRDLSISAKGFNLQISDKLDRRAEELWNRVRSGYGLTIQRSQAYMKWRFEDNPHRKYKYISVERGGELVGLAVVGSYLRKKGGRSARVGTLNDLFAISEARVIDLLVKSIHRTLRAEGCALMMACHPTGGGTPKLLRQRFLRYFILPFSLFGRRMLVRFGKLVWGKNLSGKIPEKEFYNLPEWYITEAFFYGGYLE